MDRKCCLRKRKRKRKQDLWLKVTNEDKEIQMNCENLRKEKNHKTLYIWPKSGPQNLKTIKRFTLKCIFSFVFKVAALEEIEF